MSYDDLKAAAREARYLASTAASIHGLQAAGATVSATKLLHELNQKYPEARKAIANVAMELRRARESAVHLGDVVASTAHEAAVEMVLALNREQFGVDLLGRKRVQVWPDVDALMAEIEVEYAKASAHRKGPEIDDDPEEVPPLERVLVILTPYQGEIFKYLWRKQTASYDVLKSVPGAWSSVPSDEAVTKQLKAIRTRLNKSAPTVADLTISTAKRRVTLDRLEK
jgi:hypothetical protein